MFHEASISNTVCKHCTITCTARDTPVYLARHTSHETASYLARHTSHETASYLARHTSHETASHLARHTSHETASHLARHTSHEETSHSPTLTSHTRKLAGQGQFKELQSKLELTSFVLTHCPEEELRHVLKERGAMEVQVGGGGCGQREW